MKPYFKVVAENRKARHDFSILDTCEAGIELEGAEVKSIRCGRANLKDSFARAERGQIWLFGMHISPYGFGRSEALNPLRTRKLLLAKSEIGKLIGKTQEKGLTLIPLKLYFRGNWAKVELGIAKAKKVFEKRETLRKKTIDRETSRELRERSTSLKLR